MKKINYLLLIVLSAFAFLVSSCSKPNTPEAAAEGFYQALIDKDKDEAVSYFDLKNKDENDLVYGKISVIFNESVKKYNIKSCRSVSAKSINQDTYEVEVEFLDSDKKVVYKDSIRVKNVDGSYKVII